MISNLGRKGSGGGQAGDSDHRCLFRVVPNTGESPEDASADLCATPPTYACILQHRQAGRLEFAGPV